MADKSSQLVLAALTRAAADPVGLPLYGTRSTPGLFPGTALGKQTAQRCHDDGYLRPVEGSACTITEKGLTYLLGQVSPRQVLEDFVRVLESREAQVGELLDRARRMQSGLEAMRASVAAVLGHIDAPGGDLKKLFSHFRQEPAPPAGDPAAEVRDVLAGWARAGAAEDCPLPDLYTRVANRRPGTTIGAFHDVLRRLHDEGVVYLHPWTGPLYAIPRPPFALMVGHEIAYYASLREASAAA